MLEMRARTNELLALLRQAHISFALKNGSFFPSQALNPAPNRLRWTELEIGCCVLQHLEARRRRVVFRLFVSVIAAFGRPTSLNAYYPTLDNRTLLGPALGRTLMNDNYASWHACSVIGSVHVGANSKLLSSESRWCRTAKKSSMLSDL